MSNLSLFKQNESDFAKKYVQYAAREMDMLMQEAHSHIAYANNIYEDIKHSEFKNIKYPSAMVPALTVRCNMLCNKQQFLAWKEENYYRNCDFGYLNS